MKSNHLRLSLAAIITTIAIPVNAYDFKVDGLCYNILSEEKGTVEITYYDYGSNFLYVKGDLEIPKEILHENKTYTVASIGKMAFIDCQYLTSITIPNSVTKIGLSAFMRCSLTSIAIPASVTSIPEDFGCRSLTEINVDIENPVYCSENGILYTKDKSSLLRCPSSKEGQVAIPNSVTKIDRWAFSDCIKLESVIIPNSVISIGAYSFRSCWILESITIPNSVTSIGEYAFSNGNHLKHITLSNSITSIENNTFERCYVLENITIPNSVTYIGKDAFQQCLALKNVTMGNSVTNIDDAAFFNCNNLETIDLPNSLNIIGASAFYGCRKLTSIVIPHSVTSIGDNLFGDCSSINSVYCQWTNPIEVYLHSFFPKDVMTNAVLYVPTGCKSAYENVSPWKNFIHIEEMEYSGIKNVDNGNIEVTVEDGSIVVDGCADVEVYSMSGQLMYRGSTGRVENLTPGIYDVRVGGKTVKVLVGK